MYNLEDIISAEASNLGDLQGTERCPERYPNDAPNDTNNPSSPAVGHSAHEIRKLSLKGCLKDRARNLRVRRGTVEQSKRD